MVSSGCQWTPGVNRGSKQSELAKLISEQSSLREECYSRQVFIGLLRQLENTKLVTWNASKMGFLG